MVSKISYVYWRTGNPFIYSLFVLHFKDKKMEELITELITAAGGIITTIVAWFLAKRKYAAEVDHTYLENLQEGLRTYDSIINHNKAEIEFILKDNEDLRKEVSDLRKPVLDLTLNICMDLTCARRVREHQIIEKTKEGKIKSKLNTTEGVG